MPVSLNFSGVEPAEPFKLLDEGTYTLIHAEAKIQKNKKEPDTKPETLALVFDVEGTNNKLWHYIYLGDSDMNLKFILQYLVALFGGRENLPSENIDFNDEFCAAIIGQPIRAVVEQAPRDDNPQKMGNKITSFEVMPL